MGWRLVRADYGVHRGDRAECALDYALSTVSEDGFQHAVAIIDHGPRSTGYVSFSEDLHQARRALRAALEAVEEALGDEAA